MARQHLLAVILFIAGLLLGLATASGLPSYLGTLTTDEEASNADAAHQSSDHESREASGPGERPSLQARTINDSATPASNLSDGSSAPNADLERRFRAMASAWTQLQGEVASLRTEIAGLRQRLSGSAQSPLEPGQPSSQSPAPNSPEGRRLALITAGVDEERAADLVWLQGQQELERLELYDLATREGWFGTDRYREQVRKLDQAFLGLRGAIGEDAYDRYLFAAGEDNRIEIDSIIPGSTADDAGLQSGDLVESYAGQRVFRYSDLRSATLEGERDELVPVRVRRGEAMIDIWIPRGPLGVRLEGARADPEA